ncbi:MAG: DNA repair protein RecN [Methylococcus sp.]|nr:DNA repair protein RecN [Methylococcus sp.]
MLANLSIRDLAVVAALDLDLRPGFTVLTGETGAGKSILLTALGLALGDRADSGLVRPGAERGEVSLCFDLADAPAARDWLLDNELAEPDEDTCLIRRTVSADGRSRAFINGRAATLPNLQALGRHLVEIHGQHAHLNLLQAGEQRALLDRHAGGLELAATLKRIFERWKEVSDRIDRLQHDTSSRNARQELLQYQVNELEQFDIETLDYRALSEEHELLANLGRVSEIGYAQLKLLYEDEQYSVNGLLAQSTHAVGELAQISREFAGTLELVESARIQVKEAAMELRHHLDALDPDPARFAAVEQRLAEVHQLGRKHQVRPEGLPGHLEALRTELRSLATGEEQLDHLLAERQDLLNAYDDTARNLSQQRRQAATALETDISRLIHELGMPHGRFAVAFETDAEAPPAPHGRDKIEFLVSANPGLPPRPLSRVASGGELSRISLAIEVASIAQKTTPSLIYDEVDTGIGGGVAEMVGIKLRSLGINRQVLCVTHLPQIAALGHQHLLVEKRAEDGITQSTVRPLEMDERTGEVARMLGGLRITEQTLAHAREMLMLAQ